MSAYLFMSLDCQIIFFLVGDGLIKNTRQYFAEQPRDHKDQDYNKYSRREVEKKTAGCDYCDKKAVNTHFLKAHHVFPDKAVVSQHGTEHFSKLLQDQYRKYAGEKEQQAERIIIFCKVVVESAVKLNAQGKCGNYDNSCVKHGVQ